ncbi:MAG: hypothetical protein QOJ76_38 [Acidobacteriota bacterium]|nr:hypothetical protein [Acidobacteriota bacterium]
MWEGIERFVASPGKVLSKIRAAMAAGSGVRRDAPDPAKMLAAKRREEERVITWARQGRITEAQLDAQPSNCAVKWQRLRSSGRVPNIRALKWKRRVSSFGTLKASSKNSRAA